MVNIPLFKKFIEYLINQGYSEQTVYNYKRDLISFRNFLQEKGVFFKEADSHITEKYKNYLASNNRKTVKKEDSTGLSKASINRMLSSLKKYFSFLREAGLEVPVPPENISFLELRKRHSGKPYLKDKIKASRSSNKN